MPKNRQTRTVVVNPPEENHTPTHLEVPVRRIAEYIPASFLAIDDDAEDALNDPEARIYKNDDNSIALVFNAGMLEFNIEALKMVCERVQDMSVTDMAEVLDLVED